MRLRRLLMGVVVVLGVGGVGVSGQELVFDFTLDTAVYDMYNISANVFPRTDFLPVIMAMVGPQYFAIKKKNSSVFDIFHMSGKIGTFTLSPGLDQNAVGNAIFSQTFIDNDEGWEILFSLPDKHMVIDDNGNILLTITNDSTFSFPERPFLGFDGNTTYVGICSRAPPQSYKAWRFRTNVSSSSAPPTLAKTAFSGPLPMMTFGPAGDYRVSLQPAGGGKTSVQIFDMLGRCIFTKAIDDITRPTSFTIPENNLPRTPFIAKVRDGNGSSVKREISVR